MGHVGADFGGLLKAMREARRISQSKLAERADFDHSYVSRLESGARMPTRDAVERLASALTLAQSEEDGFWRRRVSFLGTFPVCSLMSRCWVRFWISSRTTLCRRSTGTTFARCCGCSPSRRGSRCGRLLRTD